MGGCRYALTAAPVILGNMRTGATSRLSFVCARKAWMAEGRNTARLFTCSVSPATANGSQFGELNASKLSADTLEDLDDEHDC